MRKTKYRIWAGKRMVYDDCYMMIDSSDGQVWENRPEGRDNLVDRSDYISLQYTGLKDKNGKEIYEGDIVKYHYFQEAEWSDYKDCDIIKNGEIIFKEGAYHIYEDEDYQPFLTNCCIDWIEVIGNIYEKPELLK